MRMILRIICILIEPCLWCEPLATRRPIFMPNDSASSAFNSNFAGNRRYVQPVLKDLPPEIRRAAEALWSRYETLDIEVITTMEKAANDLFIALPAIEGFGDEIGQLAIELVADIRANFCCDERAPLRLRFAYQNQDELIEQLMPSKPSRLVLVPMDKDLSLHTNVEGEKNA